MDVLKADQLETMSKSDLVTYANMTYGCNVNSQMAKHDIIATIEKSAIKFAGNNAIKINDENLLQPGYSRIKINKTEINKRGRPVILSLNGKAASLPVGVEITVPV